MTFISLSFVLFLAVSFAAFFICPVKYRWIALLVISVAFYAISGPENLPFILFTTLSVFLCARGIGSLWKKQESELAVQGLDREKKKEIKQKFKSKRKKLLILAIVLNVGLLCVIKFTKFFVEPINGLLAYFAGEASFSAKDIIVPLGVSYYTFSTVGYLLDVYWKRYDCEKNFFRFALYTMYFPHILQGPIARYNSLGVNLKKELRFDSKRVLFGFELMLWGFFKKLVIADRLNIFISAVYDQYNLNQGLFYLVAAIFDVFYIYADFSGCMDIARGVSQIFGVELDLNFNHPFLSKSVTEFWRRWHISLGEWFKDYVYYPVSTSSLVKNISKGLRKKNAPSGVVKFAVTVIPVFVTWILTGLWHGTGKTYLAWGLYYAILITLSAVFSDSFQQLLAKLKIRTDTATWQFVKAAKVFTIFMGGRLLTAPGGLGRTALIVKSILTNFNFWIFTNGTFMSSSKLGGHEMIIVLLAIALLIVVDILQETGEKSLRERIYEENLFTQWILIALLAFSVAVFGVYGTEYDASSFVYMGY